MDSISLLKAITYSAWNTLSNAFSAGFSCPVSLLPSDFKQNGILGVKSRHGLRGYTDADMQKPQILRKPTATTTVALSANLTPTSTKAMAAWPLGKAAEAAADGERVQAKVQRFKTGPIQLREHTATEKHAALEASRWQPHH